MAEINIETSQWRYVEVGRIVLFTHGEFAGRLATTVEIVDHKRVSLLSVAPDPPFPFSWSRSILQSLLISNTQILVDGPASKQELAIPRHSASLANLILTPIVIEKLPRGAGRGAVKKAWEKQEVEKKWEESAWAKRREQRQKRRNLSDFERFQVLKLKKQVGSIFSVLIPVLPAWVLELALKRLSIFMGIVR